MKNKVLRIALNIFSVAAVVAVIILFRSFFSDLTVKIIMKSAEWFLPCEAVLNYEASKEEKTTEKEEETTEDIKETTIAETTEKAVSALLENSFYETPEDIQKLISRAKKNSSKDKKDGAIFEKQYKNEGVTDKFGVVKVKNTNKTKISVENLLEKKADLSVDKEKPSVLIFHTHTTESYQILDRDFYAVGHLTRSNDSSKNMVRVGEAIVEELEKAGFNVIHDKTVYDTKYSGAYERSRTAVIEYLKKYPTIQVVLDIHRDAIEEANGTKIKPVAKINGKKAAQVMIISGCQEEGNGIEDFPDWKENLVFALQLQKSMEENFSSLTRPLFFCPRRYNMHLTHCSLLLEVGSDSNTLEEAVFSGSCIGKSLALLMEKYTEK